MSKHNLYASFCGVRFLIFSSLDRFVRYSRSKSSALSLHLLHFRSWHISKSCTIQKTYSPMPLLHHHFHNIILHHHFYNMIQTSAHFFLPFPHIAHLLSWLLNQKQNLDWPVVLSVPESSQSSSLFFATKFNFQANFVLVAASWQVAFLLNSYSTSCCIDINIMDIWTHNASFCILFSQLAERCRHFWRPSMFVVLQDENHPDQHLRHHHHRLDHHHQQQLHHRQEVFLGWHRLHPLSKTIKALCVSFSALIFCTSGQALQPDAFLPHSMFLFSMPGA